MGCFLRLLLCELSSKPNMFHLWLILWSLIGHDSSSLAHAMILWVSLRQRAWVPFKKEERAPKSLSSWDNCGPNSHKQNMPVFLRGCFLEAFEALKTNQATPLWNPLLYSLTKAARAPCVRLKLSGAEGEGADALPCRDQQSNKELRHPDCQQEMPGFARPCTLVPFYYFKKILII